MKCPKCTKDFSIKDVALDSMKGKENNLFFECPNCDTPLEMIYSLKED